MNETWQDELIAALRNAQTDGTPDRPAGALTAEEISERLHVRRREGGIIIRAAWRAGEIEVVWARMPNILGQMHPVPCYRLK